MPSMSIQPVRHVASFAASGVTLDAEARHLAELAETKAKLLAVKPSEVRAAARDFFRPERMNLSIVSPLKSSRGLAELLTW